MSGANASSRSTRRSIGGLKLVLGLLLVAIGAGCANKAPRTIDLMPAPAVFTGGKIDLLPSEPPTLSHSDFGLLYATDRKASEDPSSRPFYLNEEGFIVRMGSARVQAVGPALGWDEARRISLSEERRRGDYQLQIQSVEESSVLADTHTLLTREPKYSSTSDRTGKVFAARVDERLAQSDAKDVYIYVHGYRVAFDDPVLIAAELWHFLGYRGAFIAYAWPSTPNPFAYASDVETASTMARKLRLFLAYLAENTKAERIHILGYSAGSRLVARALEQMALMHAADSEAEIRRKWRIGNVIFVGADLSREAFGASVMDGLLRIAERTVVYASTDDTALAWARFIFGRGRMGEMWNQAIPPRAAAFLRQNPSLEFIDVTHAAGSSTGNGHAYFRKSPWVSSDILSLLAFNLNPRQRGLERDEDLLIWRFPPDYIERLQKSLMAINRASAAIGNE